MRVCPAYVTTRASVPGLRERRMLRKQYHLSIEIHSQRFALHARTPARGTLSLLSPLASGVLPRPDKARSCRSVAAHTAAWRYAWSLRGREHDGGRLPRFEVQVERWAVARLQLYRTEHAWGGSGVPAFRRLLARRVSVDWICVAQCSCQTLTAHLEREGERARARAREREREREYLASC